MKELKVHIQDIMWELMNYKNATETAKKISRVHGLSVITDHQVRNWFSKFHSGDTLLRDETRLGCSSNLDQDALRKFVECNPHKSNIITSDKKWVFYDNVQHKRQWIDKDEPL